MSGENSTTDETKSESERWKRDVGGRDISGEDLVPDTLKRAYQSPVTNGPRVTVYEIDSPTAGTNLSDIFQAASAMRDGHAQTVRDATLRTMSARGTSMPVGILTEGEKLGVNDPNILEKNDVVAYSMTGIGYTDLDKNGKPFDTISYGAVKPFEIADAMAAARDDIAIIMQSAGNGGDNLLLSNGLERQVDSADTIHPYLMKVGAAKADLQGNLNMEVYSSRIGPSFVSAVPEGMHYQEPLENKSLSIDLVRSFTQAASLDAAAGFTNSMTTREQIATLTKDLTDAGTDAASIKKIDREAETGSVYSTLRVISEIADAGEAKSRKERNEKIDATKGASVEGTSFTAPVAAGLMAEAKDRHPGLSNYEYMSAMRISARPFIGVKDNDANIYTANGNDRLWSVTSGFGYMDPAKLNDRVLPEMEKLRKQGVTSVEKNLETERMAYAEPSNVENGRNVYEIPVTDSATVLNQDFSMVFKNRKIPPEVEIIAPNGQSVKIAPSRSFAANGVDVSSVSNVTTDAHFGSDSRGMWKIAVPEGYDLASVQSFMTGVERGGVIDKTIAAFPQEKPSVLKINPDLSATPVATPAAPTPSNDKQGMVFIPAASPGTP